MCGWMILIIDGLGINVVSTKIDRFSITEVADAHLADHEVVIEIGSLDIPRLALRLRYRGGRTRHRRTCRRRVIGVGPEQRHPMRVLQERIARRFTGGSLARLQRGNFGMVRPAIPGVSENFRAAAILQRGRQRGRDGLRGIADHIAKTISWLKGNLLRIARAFARSLAAARIGVDV